MDVFYFLSPVDNSGVIIVVIIVSILLVAILGSVFYFLYKKGKLPCGRSGKQEMYVMLLILFIVKYKFVKYILIRRLDLLWIVQHVMFWILVSRFEH